MARGAISGLAVTIGAAGLYLVYAGFRNVPLLSGLRELAAGRLPAGTPSTPTPVIIGKRAERQDSAGAAGGIGAGAIGGASGLIKPVVATVGDLFGAPRPGGRLHKGVDLICAMGTPIHAAANGKVTGRGYDLGAGNYINLDHPNGLRTKYFHLSRFNISNGEQVTQGQVIGFVGSTGNSSGPHLHFEVWENGAAQDPLKYIPR